MPAIIFVPGFTPLPPTNCPIAVPTIVPVVTFKLVLPAVVPIVGVLVIDATSADPAS